MNKNYIKTFRKRLDAPIKYKTIKMLDPIKDRKDIERVNRECIRIIRDFFLVPSQRSKISEEKKPRIS